MTRSLLAALVASFLCAGPATAQDRASQASSPRERSGNGGALAGARVRGFAGAQAPGSEEAGRLHIGAVGGAAAVEHVGGLAGGELAVRLWDRFEVFGEGLWMADVVARRRVDQANTIGTFLQNSQGAPASSRIVAPAAYGGAGLRVTLLRPGTLRVYAAITGGAAHVAYQPTFRVGGADVTGVLERYGVVLGRDLSDEVTRSAYGGGAGVRIPRGRWYLDGSVRLTSIQMTGQPANVIHANAILGLVF